MIKKISLIFLLALISVSSAWASLAVGSWKQHPVFGVVINSLVDTPDKVFYVTSGTLYSYDKKAGETRSYTADLSDYDVDKIFYNFDSKYLLVAYSNANIDLIYDNGEIVNLPDIKDVNLDLEKKVLCTDFYKGKIYVGTTIGLVIYDEKKGQVTQSGIYKKNVNGIMANDENLYIAFRDYDFKRIPVTGRINSIDNFEHVSGVGQPIKNMHPLDRAAESFVVDTQDGLQMRCFKGASKQTIGTNNQYKAEPKAGVFYTKQGLGFIMDNAYYTIDSKGTVTKAATIPSQLSAQVYATYNGSSSIWSADFDGIANYDISGSTVKVLSDKARPQNPTTANKICSFFPNSKGDGFFLVNRGPSMYIPGTDNDGEDVLMGADLYRNGTLITVNPKEPLTFNFKNTEKDLARMNVTNGVLSPTFVLDNPQDPEMVLIGSSFEGIYVLKNGKQVAKFYGPSTSAVGVNPDNFPMNDWWGTKVMTAAFDPQGNLWVGGWADNGSISVLPAAKLKNLNAVKKSDWIEVLDKASGKDYTILPCKHSNMVFIKTGMNNPSLLAIDTHGNYTNPKQFTTLRWSGFIDQDGKSLPNSYVYSITEDKNGKVWLAIESGVIEIPNPTAATDPSMSVNYIKVPRNDGSGLADYLLSTDIVTSISVDGSNRKWLATKNSGLFLVSPTGDEIIQHFTSDNSPLPSNELSAVYADPNSNSVFIGTNYGMFEYSSDSAPAAENFDEVYAYPNPVTPDYGGWVTITNLMDNSLVKICDSQLNVVKQIRSEGGLAQWDGCNMQGQRVKSGVYYVVASSGTETGGSSTGGVVTKIMVIR